MKSTLNYHNKQTTLPTRTPDLFILSSSESNLVLGKSTQKDTN